MSISMRVAVAASLSAVLSGCQSSSTGGRDAGDAGGSIDAGEDAGDAGGTVCSAEGEPCGELNPCCQSDNTCDPVQVTCVPTIPDAGGGTGGLPENGIAWQPQPISASALVATLDSVRAPSVGLQISAGSGAGLGQVLVRIGDGGWSPRSTSSGVSPTAFYGVWADATGNVFAAGETDGGGLLVFGSLDAGLETAGFFSNGASDGGQSSEPAVASLRSVLSLGDGEALAVGESASQSAVAIHRLPDGGADFELLPPELVRVRDLIYGPDGGVVYALADPADPDQPAWVLARTTGTWSQLPEVVLATNIATLAVGPRGDLSVWGDDGNNHGNAFVFADGGFVPVKLPALPPITAVCEPSPGTFYVAASSSTGLTGLYFTDGGLSGSSWWREGIPASVARIDDIQADPAGNLFAVGSDACQGCPGAAAVLSLTHE